MAEIPKELVEFYESLEKISSISLWDIQTELNPSEKLEGEWREKLISERRALYFNLNDGQLLHNIQTTDINGRPTTFGLSDTEMNHFMARLNATSNPWLKSRYAHIIWQEKKHHKYAEIAIENYLTVIDNHNPNNFNELEELPNLVAAIIYISIKSKRSRNKANDVVLTMLGDKPLWIKDRILRLVLLFNNLEKDDLETLAQLIPEWIKQDTIGSYSVIQSFLFQGINLYHKLGLKEDILYELLADNEDLILKGHTDESSFVRLATIGQKAQYLKQAHKDEESEKLFAEFNRLKQSVKFSQFSTELDIEVSKKYNDYLNFMSGLILAKSTEGILAFFAMDEDILVDPAENKQSANKAIKESIVHLHSIVSFDINTNFKNLSDSEKLEKQIIDNYTISHGVRCHSLFIKVIVDGILTGKLNYYKIFRYLENHSWYGVRFQRLATDQGVVDNSTWLTMLAPSIHNLFAQFELSVLLNTNKINNFILAIDSMTVKFEGALRDFIVLRGGNTTTVKREGLVEQTLEELLENETTKKFFSEKDIEFFKYTFTKSGKNLRNNVAHAYMGFSGYTLESALLVFHCILRLGKYNVERQANL